MNHDIINNLTLLEELALNAGLEDDQFVRYCFEWLSIRYDENLSSNLYGYLLDKQQTNVFIDDIFEIPQHQEELEGQLTLGKIMGKEKLELKHDVSRLHMHVLVGGTSGSGKTNFAKVLIEELVKWIKHQ